MVTEHLTLHSFLCEITIQITAAFGSWYVYEGVSKSPRTMLITRKSLIVHEFPATVHCGGVL